MGEFSFLDTYKDPDAETAPMGHFVDVGADPEEYQQFSKRK